MRMWCAEDACSRGRVGDGRSGGGTGGFKSRHTRWVALCCAGCGITTSLQHTGVLLLGAEQAWKQGPPSNPTAAHPHSQHPPTHRSLPQPPTSVLVCALPSIAALTPLAVRAATWSSIRAISGDTTMQGRPACRVWLCLRWCRMLWRGSRNKHTQSTFGCGCWWLAVFPQIADRQSLQLLQLLLTCQICTHLSTGAGPDSKWTCRPLLPSPPGCRCQQARC